MKSATYNTTIALLTASALLLLGACSTTSITSENLTRPLQVMVAADMEGAQENAHANTYYQMADQKLTQASYHIARGEDEQARQLLLLAEADATLALEVARLEERRDEVRQLRDLNRRIQDKQASLSTNGELSDTLAAKAVRAMK